MGIRGGGLGKIVEAVSKLQGKTAESLSALRSPLSDFYFSASEERKAESEYVAVRFIAQKEN